MLQVMPTDATQSSRERGPSHRSTGLKLLDSAANAILRLMDWGGAISQELAGYGQIWGLAFGAYGEASPDVHELLLTLARVHAERH